MYAASLSAQQLRDAISDPTRSTHHECCSPIKAQDVNVLNGLGGDAVVTMGGASSAIRTKLAKRRRSVMSFKADASRLFCMD